MGDRWLTILEIRMIVQANQGNVPRHLEAPVEQKVQRCEIVGAGTDDDRGGWGEFERRLKAGLHTFVPTLPPREIV